MAEPTTETWQELGIRGADARSWLHRVLSNDVRARAPGSGKWNLLLDDRGRIQHAGLLLCTGPEEFALWSEESQAEGWRAKLDFFLFAEKVVLAEGAARRAFAIAGAREAERRAELAAATLPAARGAHVQAAIGGVPVTIACDGRGRTPCFLVAAAPSELAALARTLEAAGLAPTDAERLARLRVRDGIPSFATDLADGVRPAEAGLAYAFDLDKGCYPGQETVARMETYGGPPRKLFGLELAQEAPVPTPGTRLLRAGEDVGRIGSCVRDEDTGGVRALALVAKKAWSPGSELELANGARGTLCALPFGNGELPFENAAH